MAAVIVVTMALAAASIGWSLIAEWAEKREDFAFYFFCRFLAGMCLVGALVVLIVGYAMTKVPT